VLPCPSASAESIPTGKDAAMPRRTLRYLRYGLGCLGAVAFGLSLN
jgi:hypothetical protein